MQVKVGPKKGKTSIKKLQSEEKGKDRGWGVFGMLA